MKKFLSILCLIPSLLFGQTTPTWQQTLNAGAAASVAKNVSLTTSGTMSVSAAAGYTVNTGSGDVHLNCDDYKIGTTGNYSVTVDGGTNYKEVISGTEGNVTIYSAGTHSLSVAGNQSVTIGGNLVETTTGNRNVQGLAHVYRANGTYSVSTGDNIVFETDADKNFAISTGLNGDMVFSTYSLSITANDLRLNTGTPGSGKVLTSDANGVATWTTPSSGITVGTTSITSGTTGAIPFNNAGVYGEDATKLFWDNGNDRLGLGTASPIARLDVKGSGTGRVLLGEYGGSSAYGSISLIGSLAAGTGSNLASSASDPNLYMNVPTGNAFIFQEDAVEFARFNSNSRFGVGETAPGSKIAAKGEGNTGATSTLGLRNSDLAPVLYATDDIRVSIGHSTPLSSLDIRGAGATSATSSLLVANSATVTVFKITDNGGIYVGPTAGGAPGNVLIASTGANIGSITGGENTSLGYNNFTGSLSSYNNVAIGTNALSVHTSGGNNVAIGSNALKLATTTASCIAIGHDVLKSSTTGSYANVGIGQSALQTLVSTNYNTAVGMSALFSTTGNDHTALGNYALYSSGAVDGSVGIGHRAGRYETVGGKLFIDAIDRTNEANGRIQSLIYGEFSGTIANQIFRINGQIQGTQMHNNANAPTGTTYNFVASGTYTATLTNTANVTASTAYRCVWTRTGNMVSVGVYVDATPTLTVTDTQLSISLPIASNFTAANDAQGSSVCPAISGQSAALYADATNDRLIMQWKAGDVTSQKMIGNAVYEVK